MVSLRRRRLLGLCSENNSRENLALYENSSQNANPKSEQSVVSNVAGVLDSVVTQSTVANDESGSSNVYGSSPSKEQPTQQYIDKMATLQDRELKLAQQEKKNKASKKGRTALVADQLRNEVGHGSGSSNTSSSSPNQMTPVKRPRVEEHIDLTRDIAQKKFLLPPCFAQRGFFEKDNLLTVSAAESSIIKDLGAAGRRKVLDEGAAAIVRVLKMALVLNDREDSSSQDLEKLRGRNVELEGKIAALRTSFADYKEQYQVQAGLVIALREKTKEVQDLTKSLESLKLEHAAEKKKLEDEIADLKAAAAPAKDESKEMKLMTRAQLVERIKLLENDCIDGVKFGFDNAVAQIKVVNPEVEINTEVLSILKKVEDGKLIFLANCASDSEDDDSDEDGPEVENGEDA